MLNLPIIMIKHLEHKKAIQKHTLPFGGGVKQIMVDEGLYEDERKVQQMGL